MAVSRGTSFAASITPYVGTVRVTRVVVMPSPLGTAVTFLKIWDANAPALGSAVTMEFPIPLHPAAGAPGSRVRQVMNFPGGGFIFTTALAYGVTTTFGGAGGATAPDAPLSVEVYYQPLA